jgi:hypothetical protein
MGGRGMGEASGAGRIVRDIEWVGRVIVCQ